MILSCTSGGSTTELLNGSGVASGQRDERCDSLPVRSVRTDERADDSSREEYRCNSTTRRSRWWPTCTSGVATLPSPLRPVDLASAHPAQGNTRMIPSTHSRSRSRSRSRTAHTNSAGTAQHTYGTVKAQARSQHTFDIVKAQLHAQSQSQRRNDGKSPRVDITGRVHRRRVDTETRRPRGPPMAGATFPFPPSVTQHSAARCHKDKRSTCAVVTAQNARVNTTGGGGQQSQERHTTQHCKSCRRRLPTRFASHAAGVRKVGGASIRRVLFHDINRPDAPSARAPRAAGCCRRRGQIPPHVFLGGAAARGGRRRQRRRLPPVEEKACERRRHNHVHYHAVDDQTTTAVRSARTSRRERRPK